MLMCLPKLTSRMEFAQDGIKSWDFFGAQAVVFYFATSPPAAPELKKRIGGGDPALLARLPRSLPARAQRVPDPPARDFSGKNCATIARPLRDHCATAARPLRDHGRPLRDHCATTARPLSDHRATSARPKSTESVDFGRFLLVFRFVCARFLLVLCLRLLRVDSPFARFLLVFCSVFARYCGRFLLAACQAHVCWIASTFSAGEVLSQTGSFVWSMASFPVGSREDMTTGLLGHVSPREVWNFVYHLPILWTWLHGKSFGQEAPDPTVSHAAHGVKTRPKFESASPQKPLQN